MPTLQQLPQATTVDPTDQMLVEKAGVAYVSDAATLLANTQPLLTFAPGTLVGRTNPTVAGGPQPVQVGTGLTLQAGQLSVDAIRIPTLDSPAFTGIPTAPTPPTLDASTALATTAFVQANIVRGQAITLTGDVSGSGFGNVPTTLPTIIAAGTYSKVQVNAKGQVVGGSQLLSGDVTPLLPIATTSSAGVVKIGAGLSAQPDGTVNVNTGLRTVQDFGAVGDGVTDDTAAFAAYGAWLRQQRSVNGAQQAWVLGFGRRYIVSDTLDFTKYKYITFDGQGSQIISNVRGFAAIDGLGMENRCRRHFRMDIPFQQRLRMARSQNIQKIQHGCGKAGLNDHIAAAIGMAMGRRHPNRRATAIHFNDRLNESIFVKAHGRVRRARHRDVFRNDRPESGGILDQGVTPLRADISVDHF